MLKKLFTVTALAALLAPAFATEWLDYFAAAKSKAKENNKLILVDFTGSDWCHWCIKLRKEVLDTPEFDAYAQDRFVLMEVDCPRKKKQDIMLSQQNQKLCQQYNISGFPTLLVMNAEGEVVGGFGGYKKMDDVKATLDKAIKADADIRAAKQLPEDQQKNALDAVYQSMDPAARKAGGYKMENEVAIANQRSLITAKLSSCKSAEEQAKVLAELEPSILPANRSFFLDRKFTVLINAAETMEDMEAAHKVGDELVGALREPFASHIKKQIDSIYADPAAFLDKLKAARDAAAAAPEAK